MSDAERTGQHEAAGPETARPGPMSGDARDDGLFERLVVSIEASKINSINAVARLDEHRKIYKADRESDAKWRRQVTDDIRTIGDNITRGFTQVSNDIAGATRHLDARIAAVELRMVEVSSDAEASGRQSLEAIQRRAAMLDDLTIETVKGRAMTERELALAESARKHERNMKALKIVGGALAVIATAIAAAIANGCA